MHTKLLSQHFIKFEYIIYIVLSNITLSVVKVRVSMVTVSSYQTTELECGMPLNRFFANDHGGNLNPFG